jgi:hypothetical protein
MALLNCAHLPLQALRLMLELLQALGHDIMILLSLVEDLMLLNLLEPRKGMLCMHSLNWDHWR